MVFSGSSFIRRAVSYCIDLSVMAQYNGKLFTVHFAFFTSTVHYADYARNLTNAGITKRRGVKI